MARWMVVHRDGGREVWNRAVPPRCGDVIDTSRGRRVVFDIVAGPAARNIHVRPLLSLEEEAQLAGQLVLW